MKEEASLRYQVIWLSREDAFPLVESVTTDIYAHSNVIRIGSGQTDLCCIHHSAPKRTDTNFY